MKQSGLTVMKFGGTSVASSSSRDAVVQQIRRKHLSGVSIVVVVSAMGRLGDPYATDTLLDLVTSLSDPPAREIDALVATGEQISAALLASMLEAAGVPAVSLRGWQAGIITGDKHHGAAIAEIRPERIRSFLAGGRVVVVAGYQGITPTGDISTLRRGGSDTTAIALAGALAADAVEIYTDVEGILSADPQMVPSAVKLPEITYEEAAELAQNGATVLHPDAADLARSEQIPVIISHAGSDSPGTKIVSSAGRWIPGSMLAPRATAVASTRGIALIDLPINQTPGDKLAEDIFSSVAERSISMDMICVTPDRLSFTVPMTSIDEISKIAREWGAMPRIVTNCAKVSLVGGGIHGVPGIMHHIVRALVAKSIVILQSVDSNTVISVLIDAKFESTAVSALHDEFFLPSSV